MPHKHHHKHMHGGSAHHETHGEIIPQQLTYGVKKEFGPNYRFLKVPLNNIPSGSVAVSNTSTQLLEWKLPICVCNLGKSFIQYNLNVGACGTNGHVNYTFEDVFDLCGKNTNLFFGTGSGVPLVSLDNANAYIKIARKLHTSQQEIQTKDPLNALYTTQGTPSINNLIPGNINMQAGNLYNFAQNANEYISYNPLEPVYCIASGQEGAAYSGAGASVINRPRQFPLSALKETYLAQDRNTFHPLDMYLRLYTGNGNQMAFENAGSGNPATGAIACSNTSNSGAAITVNNIYLYLAVETREPIIQAVMQKSRRDGLRQQIPYVVSYRNLLGTTAGSTANIAIQISRQFGKRLKWIINSVANANETLNTAYDHSNWNGCKVASYQTFLDQKNFQDQVLSCAQPTAVLTTTYANALINCDDWRENKRFAHKTCITNKGVYDLNWFHIDSFVSVDNDYDPEYDSTATVDQGLLITDQMRLYSFQATLGAAVSNPAATFPASGVLLYSFFVFLRDTEITDSGVNYI